MSELPPGTLLSELYRIDAFLGRGRTSTVYRARDLKLHRDVAVRIGDQAGAFAMARLFHPNLATVFEVGERDGQPFAVMEYVRGETGREWLTRTHTWREIVALFISVGEGLAAAHAAGLLHHDFKPEHILIDAEGRPRIAAFGLGSAEEQLAEQRAFRTCLTEALAAHATPTRLRRVLAESHADMTSLLAALRRAGEPRRTRRVIVVAAVLVVAIAAIWIVHVRRRDAVLERCDRVANAATWTPASRARVARALFGTGLATADATWQTTAASVDRFVMSWQSQARDVCIDESAALHDRREICLDRARIELAAVLDRLGEIDRAHLAQTGRLTGSLPDLAPCARADSFAAVDPERRAKLEHYFTELANVESLDHAGRFEQAARRCDELVRLADGLDSKRDQAQARYLAGQIDTELGRFADATRLFESALTTAEAAAEDSLVAAIATALVDLLGNREARYQDAQEYVRFARAAAERVGDVGARTKIAQVVGRVELVAGHFEEADHALAKALQLAEGAHDDHDIASISSDYSRLASARGKPAQAEPHDRRALAIYAAEFGPEHPLTLTATSNLATTLGELGHYDEARTYFEQVLAVTERVYPNSQDLAYALNNVASAAAQAGDFARARGSLERSLAIFEHTLEPTHPTVITVTKNLGDIASYEGRFDQAAAFYTHALELDRRATDDRHLDIAVLLIALSDVAFARNDPATGRDLCNQAHTALGKTGGDNPALVIAIDTCLGSAELAANHTAGAIELLELANKLAAKEPDLDPSALASTRFELARALVTRAPARAVALATTARELFAHEGAFATRQLAEVDAWLREHH
ncbi:MAG TPA: tetratricopeptide repeat-containing protein kinase family protein [Kofleriaceae bacterium]|nr:tetratricopeptide repeat-containing protein kinase family protein [Kofleriaceae bacterium]